MASDIVTVSERVGVAFSFAEKVEQSVFLRWDRLAVSLSRWCHYHPLAVASFGGWILTGQWLRWRSRRAMTRYRRKCRTPATRHSAIFVDRSKQVPTLIPPKIFEPIGRHLRTVCWMFLCRIQSWQGRRTHASTRDTDARPILRILAISVGRMPSAFSGAPGRR